MIAVTVGSATGDLDLAQPTKATTSITRQMTSRGNLNHPPTRPFLLDIQIDELIVCLIRAILLHYATLNPADALAAALGPAVNTV